MWLNSTTITTLRGGYSRPRVFELQDEFLFDYDCVTIQPVSKPDTTPEESQQELLFEELTSVPYSAKKDALDVERNQQKKSQSWYDAEMSKIVLVPEEDEYPYWSTDDGYHWYYEGGMTEESLEDYPREMCPRDEDGKVDTLQFKRGVLYYDEATGDGYCPRTGRKLEAY